MRCPELQMPRSLNVQCLHQSTNHATSRHPPLAFPQCSFRAGRGLKQVEACHAFHVPPDARPQREPEEVGLAARSVSHAPQARPARAARMSLSPPDWSTRHVRRPLGRKRSKSVRGLQRPFLLHGFLPGISNWKTKR